MTRKPQKSPDTFSTRNRKKIFKESLKGYLGLILGTFIMALGLVLFLAPAKIAPGGVSGLGIVLYHLFGIPVGVSMLIFNVPLFFLGLKTLGKTFGPRTLLSIVTLSLWTDLFEMVLHFKAASTDPLLTSLFGGILLGLGLGIVFRSQGTTGGSDILGRIINQLFNISTGTGIMIVDFFVISLAGIVFRNVNLALYGFISLYVSSRVIDLVLEGIDYAKSVYIISEKQEEIIEFITQRMNRGGTLIHGEGLFTKVRRNILFAVVTRKEIALLRNTIRQIDPKAFVIISNVHEVLGQGFRPRV